MKILLTADWHLDRNNRLEDFSKSINYIADYAISCNIKKFFILGDLYRDWQSSPVEKDLLHRVLVKLSKHKVDTYIILGNHDVDEKNFQNALTATQELETLRVPGVKVISTPQIVPVDTHTILALPHLPRRDLAAANKGNGGTEVTYIDLIKRHTAHSPSLVLGHMYLPEAILGSSDIGSESARAVTLQSLLDAIKVPMIFGDIHKPQELHANPLVMYVGSPDKITFGESTDEKRFVVYDLASNTHESVPIPTRKFIDMSVDLESRVITLAGAVNGDMPLGDGEYMVCLRAFLKVMAGSLQDSVIKFAAHGHKNSLDQLLRHEVADTLREHKPYRIKAVTFTVTDNTAVRDKAYSTALTDGEAFKYWLGQQTYSEELAARVREEGVKLLERKAK